MEVMEARRRLVHAASLMPPDLRSTSRCPSGNLRPAPRGSAMTKVAPRAFQASTCLADPSGPWPARRMRPSSGTVDGSRPASRMYWWTLATSAWPWVRARSSGSIRRETRDPLEGRRGRYRLLAAAHAKPDGDGPLDRHRVEAGVADPVELAAEVHDRLGPQRAQDRDLLRAAAAPVLEGLVEGLELDGVPAHADAEAQPAPAEHVDLGRLLGHQRRLPLREDQDAGGQRESVRDGREVRHQREGLVDDRLVRVRGQRRVGVELRIGAEDVVGHEEVVEAHRLDGPDELADGGDVGPALRLRKDHAGLQLGSLVRPS